MTIGGIMFWVTGVAAFLVIVGLLVLVHELGHFITARLSGMRVLEFGIGFPPRAKILHDDGETIYTINYLPIGGFVRLEGEETDSDDPRAFVNSSLRKQLVVLVAGVAVNLLAAVVLFFLVAWLANPMMRPTFHEITAGSPAEAAGLQVGDQILAIDGRTYNLIDLGEDQVGQFRSYLFSRAGQHVTLLVVDTKGQRRSVDVLLRVPDDAHPGVLGVSFDYNIGYVQGSPVAAVGTSLTSTGKALTLIVGALGDLAGHIASHPTQAPPGVQGPVGIAQDVGNVVNNYGPLLLLLLAAVLSANLALVNVLPIPPFDGGKMAIMVIKRVFGVRGVSAFEAATYVVGFAALMAFLVWISYFDLIRAGG
ncbi:MAG: M50 family metallopeptidase [Candidatus Limnocylindrales bacterium]